MTSARPGRSWERREPARDDIVYGWNAVRESLRAGRRRHRRLLFAEGGERNERRREVEELAQLRSVSVEEVDRSVLDRRCAGHHQGVVLVTSAYPYAEPPDVSALNANDGLVLALDGLSDPHNVGALLRSAEATGFTRVVLPKDRAAGVTPTVVAASAGAVEHLDVWQEVNVARWLERAKRAGVWVVGLALEPGAASLFEVDLRPPLVLVVGSEGAGIRRLVREACDQIVAIPMVGHIESLNASVAGALAMFEVRRWLDDSADRGGPDGGSTGIL